jgi:acyl carrier protein
MVREEVATVLGYASAEEVSPQRTFNELGFDSLAAVEVRNRLSEVTEMQMPIALIFDHPSPSAIADFLLAKLNAEATQREEGADVSS